MLKVTTSLDELRPTVKVAPIESEVNFTHETLHRIKQNALLSNRHNRLKFDDDERPLPWVWIIVATIFAIVAFFFRPLL